MIKPHMEDQFEKAKQLFIDGSNFLEIGDINSAESALLESLELLPGRESTKNNLSILYTEKGNLSASKGDSTEAIRFYKRALQYNPQNSFSWCNLGTIYADELNELDKAIECLTKSLEIDENYAEAHYNLANAFFSKQHFEKSLEHYDKALKLKSLDASIWVNKGVALNAMKHHEDALRCLNKALDLEPNNLAGITNKGLILDSLKRYSEALTYYDKAINLRPNCAQTISQKANTLNQLKRYEESMIYHNQAIKLQPDFAQAWSNKAITLNELKQTDAALENYKKAIQLDPSSREIQHNFALLNLTLKRFDEGWKNYDSRLSVNAFKYPISESRVPTWKGDKYCEHLLVISEQGIGDQIFYSSFLNEIKQKVTQVTAVVDKRLIEIFSRSFPGVNFIKNTDTLDPEHYNYQIAIGSLPVILNINPLTNKCRQEPYLFPKKVNANHFEISNTNQNRLRCGLSWKSANPNIGDQKSLDLIALKDILQLRNFEFINLQYGKVADDIKSVESQIGVNIQQIPEINLFENIDSLLSLINMCDNVITTCNVTAHLSGAIGKKTFLLVPYSQGRIWYWHDDSINVWYPSIEQYFQDSDFSWTSAIDKILKKLI